MQYSRLGDSGLFVSQLSLGAMTFAYETSETAAIMGATGQKLADKLVGMALEAGVNLFDTSNSYSNGESEIILGKALGANRQDNLIATKVSRPMNNSANAMGVSRVSIMREVENSLQRLGTDYIDLYQIHVYDEDTPLEETLRAMDDLVRQGKVRYIGVSNFTGWQIARADGIAQRLGTERFCSLQAYYSLVGRDVEKDMLPAATASGMGTLIWSPQASGFLSGKYTRDGQGHGRLDKMKFPPINKEKGFDVLDVVASIADEKGVAMSEVSLAWLLHKPAVTSVLVGANAEQQLISNLKAVEVELSVEDMARLDEVSAQAPDYPHWIPKQQRTMSVQENHRKNVYK